MARKLSSRVLIAFGVVASLVIAGTAGAQKSEKFTEWGWALPYEKISQDSINWLQKQGWWPLQVGTQTFWAGQQVLMAVMDQEGLLTRRGIEVKFQSFLGGPPQNEAFIAGRLQVGMGGNLPLGTLIINRVPVEVIAQVTPNFKHALVIHPDLPAKTFADLKKLGRPVRIGVILGGTNHFYLVAAARAHGMEIGRDIQLLNMPISEQALMPRGIDGTSPFEPTLTLMKEVRQNAREIDANFPYMFQQSHLWVRKELADNAPDVVQALADAYVEAILWTRLFPDAAVNLWASKPELKTFPIEILRKTSLWYTIWYKPLWPFLVEDFYSRESEVLASWAAEAGVLRRPVTAKEYRDTYNTKYLTNTFNKLGWAIPKRPVFIPPNWSGVIGKIPYPKYWHVDNLSNPQTWPEPGDLVRPWYFNGRTYQP